MIITQLSGKFSKGDNGIFNLKKTLLAATVTVKFPESDQIVGEVQGIPITFTPTPERTFYHVELEFFQSIRNCTVHIVHNKSHDKQGYVGKSTSVEIAYAIAQRKPVLFLYEISYAEQVHPEIKELLQKNEQLFFYNEMQRLNTTEIFDFLNTLPNEIKYRCETTDEIMVMSHISLLLKGYH